VATATESHSGSSSLYLASVFENMLVVECAHMFYHIQPMVREDGKDRLLQKEQGSDENAGNQAAAVAEPVACEKEGNKVANSKYDPFCWFLFLYFGSEIITWIWRSQNDPGDVVYVLLMMTQATTNILVFAAFIGLLCCRDGPVFEMTSHHVFTFFPFIALMAVNTVVVRIEQGWTWLQLLIDFFGYSILQIIAGLNISKDNRLLFSNMVSIFIAVFVMMIVVVLAKHESETGPSLEFIKGVIEQILVLELLHLAFQKQIVNKKKSQETQKNQPSQ
jgi:hypothetical protein